MILGCFVLVLASVLRMAWASNGDRNPFFQSCVSRCIEEVCTDDTPQRLLDYLSRWTCNDECTYGCMWKTTDAFLGRGWRCPQFYGKWPFVRMLGLQEPASVLFSLLNLAANLYMIRKFRRKVRRDSPNYWMWHIFCGICCNAWLCSIIFHARDLPQTELLDYGFAYSMVLASMVCMILRMCHNRSWVVRGLVTLFCLLFFVNHFVYLSVGKFNYAFNMKINVITGIIAGTGWLVWYAVSRKKRIYAWKMMTFQVCAALCLTLELADFPPLFYTFDAHSLWHLATVPLTVLFYNFIIDDCVQLRQEAFETEEKHKLI